jgi:hypothetical protein
MSRSFGTSGEKRNADMVSIKTPERRRPLGRVKSIYYNNIGMDLREIEWGDLD